MKLSGTLKFFAVVVALLALLCVVFPADGITIGSKTLRFPRLHNVLVREKSKDVEEILVHNTKRDLSGITDSVADCYNVLFLSQLRFWLPDGDVTIFDGFFDAAENAVADGRTVRVLHYGDSQIEQDRISSQVRERLQTVFGGGGPGMLPLRQTVAAISFNQTTSGSLVGQSTWGTGDFVRSGIYGPMLRSWRVDGSAVLSLKASKGKYASPRVGHFSSIRILYNLRGGSFSVAMHDRIGGASFQKSVSDQGIGMVEWQLDSATTSASLTISGSPDVFGVIVDDGPGVAVDNIGMRGVSGQQFRMVNANQLSQSYNLLDVGIVIMQFGGNSVPYLTSDKAIDGYCKKIGEQIDYVKAVCPQAAVLFVGPSDMATMVNGRLSTYPKLPSVVDKLRVVANEHGAAYWSIYDVMGGFESMVAWNKKGLAGSDYIHFSQDGAARMGDYLSDALLKLYELYSLRKKLSKSEFETVWSNVIQSAQEAPSAVQ